MDQQTVAQLDGLSLEFASYSGCKCPSCKYTNSFAQKGFAAWPKGKPAGKSAAKDYAAHVTFGKRDSKIHQITYGDGSDFYSLAKDTTRAQILATLRKHFSSTPDWDAFDLAVQR